MKHGTLCDNPIYAVIDTNVLVSALLSGSKVSNPSIVLQTVLKGYIVPLYDDEILSEYKEVLSRDKFPFKKTDIAALLNYFKTYGIVSVRMKIDGIIFPDKKDVVFYEIALSKEGAFLVTGNTKHFPETPIVVSPAQMVSVISDLLQS